MNVIEYSHEALHNGLFFSASTFITNLASAANFDVLFTTGPKPCHLKFAAIHEGEADFKFIEGITGTPVGGTVINAYNRNRISLTTTAVVLKLNPTGISPSAVELLTIRDGSSFNLIGSHTALDEWILKPNTNYLFRMTNQSGQNTKTASVEFSWYEE